MLQERLHYEVKYFCSTIPRLPIEWKLAGITETAVTSVVAHIEDSYGKGELPDVIRSGDLAKWSSSSTYAVIVPK